MDETCKLQRGNIHLLYVLCQPEGFLKPLPLGTWNKRKEQLTFTPR